MGILFVLLWEGKRITFIIFVWVEASKKRSITSD